MTLGEPAKTPKVVTPLNPLDTWDLEGDLSQDPIAKSLKFRNEAGSIKRVANDIHVSAVVYDEVTMKQVTVPQTQKHQVPQEFCLVDLMP